MNAATDLHAAQQYARRSVAHLLGQRHRDAVDDVLQVAAMNALKYAGDFRGDSQFKVYFTSIARNCALMHLRRMNKRTSVSIDGEAAWMARLWESQEASPERQVMQRELREDVEARIGELSIVLQGEARAMLRDEPTGAHGTRKARRFRMKREMRELLAGWRA